MQVPSLQDLMKAGLHFGHKESRWHPKMGQYIFGSKNNIHIIDLEQTQKKLESAMFYAKQLGMRKGTLLLVGTKDQTRSIVESLAQEYGLPYVTGKWLGGTLTNFSVISKMFRQLMNLQEAELDPLYEEKYTKWERGQFAKERDELLKTIGGIVTLKGIPEAMYFTDIKCDKTALLESKNVHVTSIGIVDSNGNPDAVDFPIPGNDDATKGVQLITECIVKSFDEGRKEADVKKQNQESRPRSETSDGQAESKNQE